MAVTTEGRTCPEVWERSILTLIDKGAYVASVRGPTLEIRDMILTVNEPLEKPTISKFSPKIHEAQSYASILQNHPRVVNYDKVNQLRRVVRLLTADTYSRRAIICTWDPRQDFNVENPPGAIVFTFTIRNDALHLTSLLRTTDAWMSNWTLAGFPNGIQKAVYNNLRKVEKFKALRMGTYTQIHSSFHMYLDDVYNAQLNLPQAMR